MSSLKLTSFTPLNIQTKKKVITIWQTIHDSNDSLQFRNPVDWKAMGLVDYLKYVKKPMDLNTISRQLRQQKYRTVQNVLDDIQLIFDNCKVYNAPGSWIYNLADKLQKSFIKMIRNFIPKIVDNNPKSKVNSNFLKSKQQQNVQQVIQQEIPFFIEQISFSDKIKFTDKLTHISNDNLQLIFKKIVDKNPQAVKFLPPETEDKKQQTSQKKNEKVNQESNQINSQLLGQNNQNQALIVNSHNLNNDQGNIPLNSQVSIVQSQSQCFNKIQQQQNVQQQQSQRKSNQQNQPNNDNIQQQNPKKKQLEGQKILQQNQHNQQDYMHSHHIVNQQHQKISQNYGNQEVPEPHPSPQSSQQHQQPQVQNQAVTTNQKNDQNRMQIQQPIPDIPEPPRRGRRTRAAKNALLQKQALLNNNRAKQLQLAAENAGKFSINQMQIGSKAQIFIDDLNVESFEQLMKMLEGMVEEKDKVMKKIKLD